MEIGNIYYLWRVGDCKEIAFGYLIETDCNLTRSPVSFMLPFLLLLLLHVCNIKKKSIRFIIIQILKSGERRKVASGYILLNPIMYLLALFWNKLP